MSKKNLFYVGLLLLFAVCFAGCSKSDDEEAPVEYSETSIYGTWEYICYGNGMASVPCAMSRTLTFYPNGKLEGKGAGNELFGTYVCHDSEFEMVSLGGTKIGFIDEEIVSFEENLHKVNKYSITKDGHLRLYYSGSDYFEFSKSEEVENGVEEQSCFPTCEMYVRFILPDGTNVLELTGNSGQVFVEDYYNYSNYYIGNLNVEIYNERSGKKLTSSDIGKRFVKWKDIGDTGSLLCQEMMLRLSWGNPDGNDVPHESYDDATIIKMNSANIFGDEEDHFVKWYFHIHKGKAYYDVYKCEVDGVEVPTTDEMPEVKIVQRFVTMEVKLDNSISGFLNAELPGPQDTRPASSFFDDEFTDKLYLINSREEFIELYSGKREIPEIDFQNQTLIIGRKMIPTPCWSIKQKEMKEVSEGYVLTLFLENLPEGYGAFGAFTPLYFWEIYPKLSNNNCSINIEYVD